MKNIPKQRYRSSHFTPEKYPLRVNKKNEIQESIRNSFCLKRSHSYRVDAMLLMMRKLYSWIESYFHAWKGSSSSQRSDIRSTVLESLKKRSEFVSRFKNARTRIMTIKLSRQSKLSNETGSQFIEKLKNIYYSYTMRQKRLVLEVLNTKHLALTGKMFKTIFVCINKRILTETWLLIKEFNKYTVFIRAMLNKFRIRSLGNSFRVWKSQTDVDRHLYSLSLNKVLLNILLGNARLFFTFYRRIPRIREYNKGLIVNRGCTRVKKVITALVQSKFAHWKHSTARNMNSAVKMVSVLIPVFRKHKHVHSQYLWYQLLLTIRFKKNACMKFKRCIETYIANIVHLIHYRTVNRNIN